VAQGSWMPGLPLTLVYDAPQECPAQEALRSAVENLVSGDRARPFAARVTISKAGDAYQASIASAGGSARVLRGATCAEVVEGTSVVLALAITPKGAEVDQQRPAGEARRSNQAATAPATHGVLGAAARGDLGTLPHATLGFGGQLGLERSRWSAYLAGTYWMSARGGLPSKPAFGGDFSWWTFAAQGCGAPLTGPLRLDLCAGAELGRLSGVGVGESVRPQHRSTTWAAAGASLGARWAITGAFRLQASVGVAVPFVGRRPFTLDGARVHEPTAFAARAEVGPELVF